MKPGWSAYAVGESRTTPGKTYRIGIGPGGRLNCQCMKFVFSDKGKNAGKVANCHHLDALRGVLEQEVSPLLTVARSMVDDIVQSMTVGVTATVRGAMALVPHLEKFVPHAGHQGSVTVEPTAGEPVRYFVFDDD